MGYRSLAELVVVLHFAFVAFIATGSLLALKWPRLIWFHVPVVIWAAAIVTIDFACPLTALERFLRHRGGEIAYQGGFIDHYIRGVLYPARFTTQARIVVAMLIVVGYALLLWRSARPEVTKQTRERLIRSPGDPA